MFSYPVKELSTIISTIIEKNVNKEVFNWLQEKIHGNLPSAQFNAAFAMMPRKTGKTEITITDTVSNEIDQIYPGLSFEGWTIDRLSRIWLLMSRDSEQENAYVAAIENLFLAADMNELVALYSALPVLAYPARWKARCAEGVRSNIGVVGTAVICNNPYPAAWLDDPAWNQLVMKAIFTDKPVDRIYEIDRRANAELANILLDYAHERWAAGRKINPQLWRSVGKFIDEKNFADIERIGNSNDPLEREAAALACYNSNFLQAKEWLNRHENLKSAIENKSLTWSSLALEMAMGS
ncbi:MAG: EboA domain-containing protein [Bacteroidetes bacterium]|nr:EboA domain-containing protein [Bacteroidota bacterium]